MAERHGFPNIYIYRYTYSYIARERLVSYFRVANAAYCDRPLSDQIVEKNSEYEGVFYSKNIQRVYHRGYAEII